MHAPRLEGRRAQNTKRRKGHRQALPGLAKPGWLAPRLQFSRAATARLLFAVPSAFCDLTAMASANEADIALDGLAAWT